MRVYIILRTKFPEIEKKNSVSEFFFTAHEHQDATIDEKSWTSRR